MEDVNGGFALLKNFLTKGGICGGIMDIPA